MSSEWNWRALKIDVFKNTVVASRSWTSVRRRRSRRKRDMRIDVTLKERMSVWRRQKIKNSTHGVIKYDRALLPAYDSQVNTRKPSS